MVVVSASATETARLLLNSRSKLFPRGAGNNNDWVGRNLQGHAYTARTDSSTRISTTGWDPGPASPFATSITAIRAFAAAACWQTSSLRCRTRSLTFGRRDRRAGVVPTRIFSGVGISTRCASWGRFRKCPSSTPASGRSGRQGPLGHPRGAAFGPSARQRHRDGTISFQRRPKSCSRRRAPKRRGPACRAQGLSGGQHQAGTCRMGNDPKDLGDEPIRPDP